MLLREGRVVIHVRQLPDGMGARLLQQLREVQGKPTSGGGMSIVHPRWSQGGHGDIVSALVLALWQVSGERVADPEPQVMTREWEQTRQDERKRKLREQLERPAWAPKRTHDRGAGASWRR
jgi:hypothetical protein